MASPSLAETASFETLSVGAPPEGWLLTMTGRGAPKWTVERDEGGGAVPRRSGRATYPVALKEGTNLRDGIVEVNFKPISGQEDRAGGIVWRARDSSNYYVVRANALQDNVVLYKAVNGVRSSLDLAGQKGGYGVTTPYPPTNGTPCELSSPAPASTSSSTAIHCSPSKMRPFRKLAWWGFGPKPIASPSSGGSSSASGGRGYDGQ